MNPKSQPLADLVARHVTVGRFPSQAGYPVSMLSGLPASYLLAPMVGAGELAETLLSLDDFRNLGLGGWQGVVADAVINEALDLIVPAWMEPEFGLLLEAVRIAAERQRGKSWDRIAKQTGAGILVSAVVAAIIRAG